MSEEYNELDQLQQAKDSIDDSDFLAALGLGSDEEDDTVTNEPQDDDGSDDELVEDDDSQDEDEPQDEDGDEADDEADGIDILDDSFDEVEVKIGDQVVPLLELKKGYLRQSDYTTKTQQLKEMRDTLEKSALQVEKEAIELIEDRLTFVKTDLETRLDQYSNIDWKALAQRDPELYHRHKAIHDSLLDDQRKVTEEFKAINQRRVQQLQTQKEEIARATYTQLTTEIPGWNADMYRQVLSTAIENGLPEAVAREIVDFPTLMMLYKVHQYDNSKTKVKANVKEKVKETPKVKLKANSNKNNKIKSSDNYDKARKRYESSDVKSKDDAATDLILAALRG